MSPQTSENDEDNILYELLIHTEWHLDAEIMGGDLLSQGGSIFYRTLMQTPSNLSSLASHIANSFWKRSSVPKDLAKVFESGSEWQLGVGAQGAVIAILQDASLEIRAKKDEYTSIVGKNYNLHTDPFPKWRKVSWSPECSMVAVAYSNGVVEIFNTVGASLFTIYPPRFQEGKIQVEANNALAALIFSDVRTEKIKWASELIMIDFYGKVRSYFVSPTEGYQESHMFSFHRTYPKGISAADKIGSLVIVAGFCHYINDPNLRSNGLGHGLTIWRMVNDYPYYKRVPTIDEDEYTPPRTGFLEYIPGLQAASTYDYIFRLCVSPLGRQVAALHISGSISVWDVPSLRKRKFWPLENQPGFDIQNSDMSFIKRSFKKEVMTSSVWLRNHLVDVKWWSEKAVILARFSGAVTVCSVNSLANLLGESPEFFEGVPQISETYDRCFLGLEMERTLMKSHSRSLANLSDSSELDETSADDLNMGDEADLSLIQKTKLLTLSVLFWITDSERFRPFTKRQKVVARTCRLLCLKSTTPLELFTRKIENEEYGEALALANRYNLDCDLVYQQQWRRTLVTVTSIQDYLTKIRKRSWVLAECLLGVPDDIDAARELILYGLRGTELDTLAGIADGTNDDEFVVSDLALEYDADPDLDPVESERDAQEWTAKDLARRRELLAKIDFYNLSKEQVEVVRARQILLKYYDRLSSYEVLLGGSHMAPEKYDPKFYEKFRNRTESEAAVELARKYNWRGVEVMFTYHGEATLPHRLAILSQFPPTMGPYEYRSLLPECDLSGEVFEWEEDSLRDPDWCEDSLCREAVGINDDVGLTLLYMNNPDLERFREAELTSEMVSEWYKMRAKEIEENSHFVDAALDLLKLGRERNVPNLEELQYTFDTLEVLVYEVGLNDLSLKKFESLNDLEKLKLLLSTSTPETHIQNIRRWAQSFLAHCEKREPGLGKRLLREYVVSTAKQDLSIALKTIQHSQPDMVDPILSGPEEVLRAALESIYACEKELQLPRAFAILECLPVQQPKKDSEEMCRLHARVDDLEDHLGAAELLSSHNVLVSPAFVKKVQADEAQIKLLLTKLARTAARREIRLSDDDWNKLLNDMLEMQQKVFSVIDPQTCFEILTEALLTSGVKEYITFGGELLETRCDGTPLRNPYLQRLPFHTSVKLVIKAATEYFNSSESYLDNDMALARHCLNMIQSENEEIAAELDLISGLEILPELGISVLPLQVRLCEDRLKLIAKSLETRPQNHRYGSRILHLTSLLRVCGQDEAQRRAKVLALVAEAAFKTNDVDAASSWCLLIVKEGESDGWEICARLGRCESCKDFNLRATLLDFALTHAPFEFLEELLQARNEVELRLLCSRVNDRIHPNVSLDSDDGFEDARADSEEESCDEWEDPSPESPPSESTFPSKRLLFNVTRNVFSAASTSSMMASAASKRILKNAIGWLRPLRSSASRANKAEAFDQGGNADFVKQGCHAFYTDLCPDSYVSQLGTNYKSYAPLSVSNPALDMSLTLLRIALIEESLFQGNSVHTNVTVLQEVVKGVLHEDLLLGVSFLLLLTSPQKVHEVFSSFPRTEISLQVCIYYYALQIYTALNPWNQPGIAPVFLHPPSDVVNCVRSLIDGSSISEKEDDELAAYVLYFRTTDRLMTDYMQGQALQKLNAGVDIERFLSDPQYKKDTVLGLAMSFDKDVVDLSVTLAKKYDVPLWEVYMTQLQFLFDCPDIATKDLQRAVEEREVLSCLMERPSEFMSTMEQNVLVAISGKDHDRLILYYKLLSLGCNDAECKRTAEIYINIINQIKDIACSLDFKTLLKRNADALEILKPVLTENNVDILAEVAQKIPKGEEFALQPSMVYCAWAQKHFFDTRDKKTPKTSNEWIKRFDETKEILKKLRPQDVNLLVRSFVFSEEAIRRVPLEARKEMISKAARYCQARSVQTRDESESELWRGAHYSLGKLEKHLELLRSDTFRSLKKSSDARLREFAHQFMISGGAEDKLEELSRKVLLDLCPLDVLRSLLSVYPDDVCQIPEDIFMEVLRSTLEKLSLTEKIPFSTNDAERSNDPVDVLAHLLKELKDYVDEGGDLLDHDEVMDEIRGFAKEESNPLAMRIKVLSITQQLFSVPDGDRRLLQDMKTGGIVRDIFSSPQKESTESVKGPNPLESKVDTEEERNELLVSLIQKMDSVRKANSIIELLNIWPPFQPQTYSDPDRNPWLKVFLMLLTTTKLSSESKTCVDLIYTSTKRCIEENLIKPECLSKLMEKLLKLPPNESLKCALKISLQASMADCKKEILQEYRNIAKIDESLYDDELLRLIVQTDAVTAVLPTSLYGPLVSYLSEDENSELRKTVVRQLENANLRIEAASLSMLSSSVPRALKTATATLKTFKRWL